MLTILLLAAGSSSRMRGGDKLMENVEEQPLIRTMATRALQTGCEVVVTLPPSNDQRQNTLEDLNLTTRLVTDADQGMAHSIRAGMGALPAGTSAVMILPADMPDLESTDLGTMLAAWRTAPPDTILRGASARGKPGHPVIFPEVDFTALHNISGDQGARDILKANTERVKLVPLPEKHALTDLDTPEDWADWRKSQL